MYVALNLIAVWLPRIFFGLVSIGACLVYWRSRQGRAIKHLTLRGLVVALLVFKFAYALLLSVGQYFVWKSEPLAHLLLNESLEKLPAAVTGGVGAFDGHLGYFLYYAWSRFWLDAVWSVIIAILFWGILKLLQRYRERFFHAGETTIGFLAALIVGWPNIIIFVPLVFLSVVLVSVYRLVFLKETYTTLGWPLILAAVLAFVVGHFFGAAVGLSSWRIY
ncbi:hypothetical protein M1432_02090 [Patescibacteria group bacterium]|nr:hypothetical protein [Patescibacteria group bacterium]